MTLRVPAKGLRLERAADGKGVVFSYRRPVTSALAAAVAAAETSALKVRPIPILNEQATSFEVYSSHFPIEFSVAHRAGGVEVVIAREGPARAAEKLLGPEGLDVPGWAAARLLIRYRDALSARKNLTEICERGGGDEHICATLRSYVLGAIHGARTSSVNLSETDLSPGSDPKGLVLAAYTCRLLGDDQRALRLLEEIRDSVEPESVPRLARALRRDMSMAALLDALRRDDHCLVAAHVINDVEEARRALGPRGLAQVAGDHLLRCWLAESAVEILMGLAKEEEEVAIEDVAPFLSVAFWDLGLYVKASDTASFALYAGQRGSAAAMARSIRARAAAHVGNWDLVRRDLQEARSRLERGGTVDTALLARARLEAGEAGAAMELLDEMGEPDGLVDPAEAAQRAALRCEVILVATGLTEDCRSTELPSHTCFQVARAAAKNAPADVAAIYDKGASRDDSWSALCELARDMSLIRAELKGRDSAQDTSEGGER